MNKDEINLVIYKRTDTKKQTMVTALKHRPLMVKEKESAKLVLPLKRKHEQRAERLLTNTIHTLQRTALTMTR